MNEFAINSVLNQLGITPSSGMADANGAGALVGIKLQGGVEESGLADFNARAGVNPHRVMHTERIPLQQRRLMPPSRRLATTAATGASGADFHDDERLQVAAAGALQTLQQGDRSSLEEQLAQTYDPLERYTLLRRVRLQVDETDLSPTEKDQLKNNVNEMVTDLMDQYGDVIRSGLKQAQSFEVAVGTMDSLAQANDQHYDTDSVHQLRSQFGAKSEGKLDAPLTPLTLAYSLQTKFGANHFTTALAGLRSKLADEFRSNPATKPGPRLWMSLSDAAAFNVVQTSFAIAGDLRRDLSERAGITSAFHQSGTALALLNAAQTGAKTADTVVGQIIGQQEIEGRGKMQTYALIRQAVDKLPATAWPSPLLVHRMTLLEHLRSLALESSEYRPFAGTDEEEVEHHLRERVQRKKKRNDDATQEHRPTSENNQGDDGRTPAGVAP